MTSNKLPTITEKIYEFMKYRRNTLTLLIIGFGFIGCLLLIWVYQIKPMITIVLSVVFTYCLIEISRIVCLLIPNSFIKLCLRPFVFELVQQLVSNHVSIITQYIKVKQLR
ncbi:hypothetical protein ACTFIY_002700 [Dictyostelium cf. discoideum]